ncbi:hypothetical protein [Acrocarpospora catenulata]|uniref:hypothetical protein n=1 Tax=Acrocarpospora catenulata TaxID=2836182 RepID=UPI001BD99015|nr:hypothetical protein [Acrocarpospora catenulata]
MIRWDSALAAAATLVARGPAVHRAMAEVVREAPAYQNKRFPLSPLPLTVSETAALEFSRAAEDYVRLLNKIVRLYQTEEQVRRWYRLDPAAEALVLADRRLADQVQVCRLDGYLEQGTERPYLLENNADAPAGSLFTGRINQIVAEVLERLGVDLGPASPLTYTSEHALLDVLGWPEHVAILQPAGAVTRESSEMAAAFTAAGVDAYVADPRDLRVTRGRVHFGGRPADACWNKLNTAPWRALTADGGFVARWLDAVQTDSFTHVNPFGARYVAESKLSLALPQEPRFAELFSDEERALVARLLPWTRRVAKDAPGVDGTALLYDDLIERPHRYVLKEPYDIRGDGVTIGRAVSRTGWEDAIIAGLSDGHVAQAHIPPTAYPTIGPDHPSITAMPVTFDTYVMRGRVLGFGSKAGLNPRLNVFQGGQKLAVRVIGDVSP